MTVDDFPLARALAAGDEAAFQRLVDEHAAEMFRICYRVLGSIDDAEDAVQETFVLAYRGLGTYRGEGPPGAWLARIAVRESWRRNRVRSRGAWLSQPLDDRVEATTADRTDVVREVLAAEETAEVRRALRALPEPYREVVTLRFLGDRTLSDIAAVTGRPEATVKTHLYRGLERLRTIMRDETR
jgi:RNA polymerase sigma-70 factor (ECF subfamily)